MKMRKIILVFAAIVIGVSAYAQTDTINRRMGSHDMNQKQTMQHHYDGDRTHPDGVMMQNGKLMMVKNGQMSVCQEDEMTLSNGTKIKSDGTYLDKDGRKMKLAEGQHMDMSGNITTMQTNRDRNTDFNQNRQDHPDGVMMQNGKLMMVKNGQMSVCQEDEMTLSNGTKIKSDGTYLDKDGRKMKLTEGQHMDMSGNITPMNTEKDRNMYLVPDSLKNKEF
jgi:hypothetical protein